MNSALRITNPKLKEHNVSAWSPTEETSVKETLKEIKPLMNVVVPLAGLLSKINQAFGLEEVEKLDILHIFKSNYPNKIDTESAIKYLQNALQIIKKDCTKLELDFIKCWCYMDEKFEFKNMNALKDSWNGMEELLAKLHEMELFVIIEAINARLHRKPRSTMKIGKVTEHESLKRSFAKEYENPAQVERFAVELKNVANQFCNPNSKFIAPYLAIVQSSGVGKSRMAIEFAKSNYSTYVCLRDFTSTGYPLRSTTASFWLPSKDEVLLFFGCDTQFDTAFVMVPYYVLLMTSYITIIIAKITNLKPNEWLEEQDYLNPDRQLFANMLAKHLATNVTYCLKLLDNEDYFASINSRHRLYLVAAKLLEWKCIDLRKQCKNLDAFSIIVDEARPLLEVVDRNDDVARSYFHYLRIAANLCPTNTESVHLVLAFLDTFGTIANYVPPEIPDPSLRWIRKLSNDPNGAFDNLKYIGRFLWKSLPDNEVLQVAHYKLLMKEPENVDKLKPEMALAILGARLAVQFHAHESLSLDLVKSHGAFIYNVSGEDRRRVMIGYGNDPFLSTAAADLQMRFEMFCWTKLCKELLRSVRNGVLEAGYRGELTARVLILMAMDVSRCKAGTQPWSNISVRSFFETLIGKDNIKYIYFSEQRYKEEFLGGEVSLTHFVYVDYLPSVQNLERYYHCKAGILCQRSQDIIDIILPVRLQSGNFSCLLEQVKNFSKVNKFPKISNNIANELGYKLESPYLYKFVQIGSTTESDGVKVLKRTKMGYLGFVRETKKNTAIKKKAAKKQIVEKEVQTTQSRRSTRRLQPAWSQTKLVSLSDDSDESLLEDIDIGDDDPYCGLVGLFGLSENTYSFLSEGVLYEDRQPNIDDLKEVLHQLRTSWCDPIKAENQSKEDIKLVKGMLCLTYPDSEEVVEAGGGKCSTEASDVSDGEENEGEAGNDPEENEVESVGRKHVLVKRARIEKGKQKVGG